jgi:hypothetical protein
VWDLVGTMKYKKLGRKKSEDVMVQEDCALENCEERISIAKNETSEKCYVY